MFLSLLQNNLPSVVATPKAIGGGKQLRSVSRKKKSIDESIADIERIIELQYQYQTITAEEVPLKVVKAAEKVVKPFKIENQFRLQDSVDWKALERDAIRVAMLNALYRQHQEDEDMIVLLMAA